jgi:hypothetical protein
MLSLAVPITLLMLAAAASQPPKDAVQASPPKGEIGLAEGAAAPPFQARDQFGKEQSRTSVAGKNGTVLLFFRSADW